jgi:hypothetical protein
VRAAETKWKTTAAAAKLRAGALTRRGTSGARVDCVGAKHRPGDVRRLPSPGRHGRPTADAALLDADERARQSVCDTA